MFLSFTREFIFHYPSSKTISVACGAGLCSYTQEVSFSAILCWTLRLSERQKFWLFIERFRYSSPMRFFMAAVPLPSSLQGNLHGQLYSQIVMHEKKLSQISQHLLSLRAVNEKKKSTTPHLYGANIKNTITRSTFQKSKISQRMAITASKKLRSQYHPSRPV